MGFPVDKIPIVLSNLNVEFNHCGEDLTVLENVNVTIKQGTLVAVGAPGVGQVHFAAVPGPGLGAESGLQHASASTRSPRRWGGAARGGYTRGQPLLRPPGVVEEGGRGA